jgi:1-aminocyclopropane-1-carboxylate deaminase/D-cysteine desulfhydrase-like pyridoxal-dependent ACC family enzyme
LQSEAAGDRLDWIFHTAGTGTALPGLIAAKLMINHPVRFRSIAICAYDEDGWMSPSVIVSRVKLIMKRLVVDPPPDHRIRAEIDLDQRSIGEDYAVPTAESIAAIRELARAEGVSLALSTPEKALLACSTRYALDASSQAATSPSCTQETSETSSRSLKWSATWPAPE